MGKWRERTLGELTENFDSLRVPVRAPDRTPGPYPYFGASGVVDHIDCFLFDGEYLLIAEDGENLRTRNTPFAFLARGQFWVNNHAHIVCGNAEADTRFLLYALTATDVGGYLTGSTMPKLTQASLNRISILVPDLDEQRAIAHILGTLDDKIELNRRMSETLEAMVGALFRSWFVDFDPVRAKAEGHDPGLPSEIADLFPDSLEDSALGNVPAGWDIRALADCVEVVRGLSYSGAGLNDGGLPMHNLNSIYEGGGYKYEGIKFYSGPYEARHTARPGDVIVANTEQGHRHLLIGYATVLPKGFGSESLFSHHLYRVRPNESSWLTADYLVRLFNSPVMHQIVGGFSNGTTVNMLPLDALQRPRISVPPKAIVAAYTEIAAAARQRCEQHVLESRTLRLIQQLLLPKLISGELRIPEFQGAA